MIINHNVSALNTYNRLQLNNAGVSKSLEKLSSGLRINRAADDAAGLAISEKMRAQIKGLEQAQRNAQDGISLIQTAEGALNETQSILQRMRELSVQAANDTYTSTDRLNIQSEINQLTAEIDRISSSTQFNGKNLLDGSTAALVSTDKLTTKVFMRDGLRVLDQFGQKSAGGGNYRLDIQTSAGVAQVQKSDMFKVKHQGAQITCIDAASGITCFNSVNAPAGSYSVETVDVSTRGVGMNNNGIQLSIGCGETSLAAGCQSYLTFSVADGKGQFTKYNFTITDYCSTDLTTVCLNGDTVEIVLSCAATTTLANTVTCLQNCLFAANGLFAGQGTVGLSANATAADTFDDAAVGSVLVYCATTVNVGCGSADVCQIGIYATCAGSQYNNYTFTIIQCNALADINLQVCGMCVYITLASGSADANWRIANQVTCITNCSDFAGLNIAITSTGNVANTCLNSTLDYTNCTANLAGVSFLGQDSVQSKAVIAGEFQQNKTAGSGLIQSSGLVCQSQHYNSSMLFTVAAVDSLCERITVTVQYHEYDQYGCYSGAKLENISLKTNGASQTSSITIGNISFSAACFIMGDKDHFTAGDKFLLDVTGTSGCGDDKFVIRDTNGFTKDMSFANCYLNTTQKCFQTFYLNSSGGTVNDASFMTCIDTFAESAYLVEQVAGTTTLGTSAADDILAGHNYSFTVNAGNSSTNIAVEKAYSQSEKAVFSADGYLCANNFNASMLFEVIDIDGNAIKLRARGNAIAEGFGGSTRTFDQVICLTAGMSNDISSLDTTVFSRQGFTTANNVCVLLGAASDFRVGDKFSMFLTAGGNSANVDMSQYQRDVSDSSNLWNGAEVSDSRVTRKYSLDASNAGCIVNFNTFEMDSATGTVQEAKVTFTRSVTTLVAGTTTFKTSAQDAVFLENGLNIGDLARSSTRLYDVDKFWDANGNFILDTPQTITMVQGDGQRASITITGADTFASVRDKMNSVIACGLGQGAIVGAENADKFVSFVEKAGNGGLEALKGTLVIRSAISGPNGEINFVGNDSVIAALSLTTIQKSQVNTYTVDVTEAHAGCVIASNVNVADNNLVGVVHKNVDVQFSANSGLSVSWDETTKDFKMTGGSAFACSTFVHLADRTMVFQIGANQKQDVGAAIGNMSVYALGLENVQVTTNTLANVAIGKIDAALERVSNQRATLGALQNRLDHSIASLATTTENVTAAESRIRDVDMAKEMMAFTKYNILSQAATAMLAQANQLPQSVLQLLK